MPRLPFRFALPIACSACALPGGADHALRWGSRTTIERSQFDVQQSTSTALMAPGPFFDNGPKQSQKATLTRVQQTVGVGNDRFGAELLLGLSDLEAGRVERDSSQPSYGAGMWIRLFEAGPIAISAEARFTNNSADTERGSFDSDTTWIEGDGRLIASWSRDEGQLAWLTPRVGIGHRLLDGEHDVDYIGPALQFDAELTYAILGLSANLPGEHTTEISVEANVGDINGAQLLVTFRF